MCVGTCRRARSEPLLYEHGSTNSSIKEELPLLSKLTWKLRPVLFWAPLPRSYTHAKKFASGLLALGVYFVHCSREKEIFYEWAGSEFPAWQQWMCTVTADNNDGQIPFSGKTWLEQRQIGFYFYIFGYVTGMREHIVAQAGATDRVSFCSGITALPKRNWTRKL